MNRNKAIKLLAIYNELKRAHYQQLDVDKWTKADGITSVRVGIGGPTFKQLGPALEGLEKVLA